MKDYDLEIGCYVANLRTDKAARDICRMTIFARSLIQQSEFFPSATQLMAEIQLFQCIEPLWRAALRTRKAETHNLAGAYGCKGCAKLAEFLCAAALKRPLRNLSAKKPIFHLSTPVFVLLQEGFPELALNSIALPIGVSCCRVYHNGTASYMGGDCWMAWATCCSHGLSFIRFSRRMQTPPSSKLLYNTQFSQISL